MPDEKLEEYIAELKKKYNITNYQQEQVRKFMKVFDNKKDDMIIGLMPKNHGRSTFLGG